MTTDASSDDAAIDDDLQYELDVASLITSPRKGNPAIDPTVSLTDEGYASRYWFRGSHEANTYGPTLDSRIEDRNVQSDDQNGVVFYLPTEVQEFASEELEFVQVDPEGHPKAGFWKSLANRISLGKTDTVIAENLISKYQKEIKGVKGSEEDIAKKRKELSQTFVQEFREQLPKLLKPELTRMWQLTPMKVTMSALKQAPKRPFFYVPNWLFDWCFINEAELKRDRPEEWVAYLFTGCDNDEELITFIRTDEQPWNNLHQPPSPLRKQVDSFGNPRYEVQRQAEDERGFSIRAHNRAVQFVQTAEDVYHWENVTKTRTGFYENFEFFGAHAPIDHSDEAFHKRLVEEVRAGRMERHSALALEGRFRKYYENWLEDNYDRWLPSECYAYRDQFFDRASFHGDDWESVADAIWDVNSLQIFVIEQPEVTGVYPYIYTDWSKCKVYIAPVENRRDIVRLYNHWKMSKSLGNTRASYDIEGSDIKTARRQDHGGPHTGIKYARRERRYLKLREAAGSDPKKLLKFLGPLWSKKQPWEPIDHDGALMSRFNQKPESWIDGLRRIRKVSSLSWEASLPPIKDLRRMYLAEVRGYRNEYHWLLNDEYSTRDPVDAWKNQNGIVTLSLIHENNLRLEGPFRRMPQVWMTYANCTNIRSIVKLMWENVPPAPIVDAVEGSIAGLLHHNMEHFRPEIDKLLDGVNRSKGPIGLDKYFTGYYRKRGQDQIEVEEDKEILVINRKPLADSNHSPVRDQFEREWEWVKGWYERSDERINDLLYWWIEAGSMPGKGGASGAGGFDVKKASDLNGHAYGLGYGTLEEQQERQERLLEIGLQVGYQTVKKHTLQWLSVRIMTIEMMPAFGKDGIEVNKTWLTLNELKTKVGGLIEGGKLLYFDARDDLWPRIQAMTPRVANEPFPWEHYQPAQMDDEFVTNVLDYLVGIDSRPRRKKILTSNGSLRTALTAEITPVFKENHERYARIVEGRFFEINHHSVA